MTDQVTWLTNGVVLDVEAGRLLQGMVVVVAGDRIETVAPQAELGDPPPGARVLDCAGGTVLPGLIDTHYHLISDSAERVTDEFLAGTVVEGVISARQVVEAGVTTVRDLGCRHRGIYGLRAAIDAGAIPGPRAYVAGGANPVGGGAPPEWRCVFVDGPWEMRKALRNELRAGADWVKIVISHATAASNYRETVQFLTREEVQAAVDEGRALGRRSTCHCEGRVAARVAIEAGIDCLEHGTSLDEELVALMAERGVAYVPTLRAFFSARYHAGSGLDGWVARAEEHRRSVQRALAAGVRIGAGTDWLEAIPDADALVQELEALHEVGLTRAQALRAATIDNARILGREDVLGSIAAGKLADVVVVAGDPLDELRALASPALVMKGGEVVVERLTARERIAA